MPRPSVVAALVLLGCVVAVGPAWSAFSKTTSNASNVVTAKRIFSTTETESAWVVSDQADGTATNLNDQGALAGDGRTFNTGSWGTTFSSTRFTDTTYESPLPDGLSISGLSWDFTYQALSSTDTVCFYFEVRRASTGAVLGTHGSSGSPLRCATGTATQSISTPLPEITTSADANDLMIRVYTTVSSGSPVTVDRGVINGTAGNGYGSFTLFERKYVDQATGGAFTFPYGLWSADGTAINFSSWTSAFGTTRFLQFTFPSAFVPSGATITSATFTYRYRSATSGQSECVYDEFWNGATLITSRGSSSSSFSCSDTANNWKTDTISLPEVNTAAEVNGLVVKVFGRDTGFTGSSLDQVNLSVTYSLD